MVEYKALFEQSPTFLSGEPSMVGSIDRKDLADLAARLETPLSAQETSDLIEEFCNTRGCGLEGSERITFEDFLNMFRDHLLDLQQITEYLKLQAAPLPETSPEEVCCDS
jgi:Ca2+-binding EF-hand superfamily protein